MITGAAEIVNVGKVSSKFPILALMHPEQLPGALFFKMLKVMSNVVFVATAAAFFILPYFIFRVFPSTSSTVRRCGKYAIVPKSITSIFAAEISIN